MEYFFFFFNDTATTEIYTLSLHDALPILAIRMTSVLCSSPSAPTLTSFTIQTTLPPPRRENGAENTRFRPRTPNLARSEEHTSELQSRQYLVCRLLLEKKKKHL